MSRHVSESRSQSGYPASAYSQERMQGLFAAHAAREVESPMKEFQTSYNSPGFQQRIVAQTHPALPEHSFRPEIRPSKAPSSMAVVAPSHSIFAGSSSSDPVPSLGSYNTASTSSSLGSRVPRSLVQPGPLDDDGHVVDFMLRGIGPESSQSREIPSIGCMFHFLGCELAFGKPEQWYTHCKMHFKGKEPPRRLRCPVSNCSAEMVGPNGEDAWSGLWTHLEEGHEMSEDASSGPSPACDAALIQHLWKLKLISGIQYQDLKMHGRIDADDSSYVLDNGTSRHRRRHERRQSRRG